MATVYGVNATKNNSPSHQNVITGGQYGGRVHWMHDSYECSSTASGTDIVLGGKIPAGAYILPQSEIWFDDLGTITVNIGTSAGGTDLGSAVDMGSAAGSYKLYNSANFGTALTAASQIHLTPLASATGTIRESILYVMP